MEDKLTKNLLDVIKGGEGVNVEFKTAKKKIPINLFETICAMLNRNGGHIFLGVEDDGEIVGIYKEYVKEMKKDFANLCNNPEKIFPTIHLDIKEYNYEDKVILYIYVHESSDVHRCVGKIYDRNDDGDFDITLSTIQISNMYIRKSNTYIENKIYPYATMDDLRIDIIEQARIMAVNRTSNHPWGKMTDMEMLRSAGLYDKDTQTGKEGFNLACILLFGKDTTILSALSYYKTDALLKVKNVDRYDDRDYIRTNLIESYERLVEFIKKHLNDKFHLEGDKRISARDVIARELCANMLMHREYSSPYPARLIITKDAILTENANKPKMIGYIDINNYIPYTKNPKIAGVFKEIGLADELGSGIRKMTYFTKIYSGGMPEFEDGDVFKVKVPLEQDGLTSNDDENGTKVGTKVGTINVTITEQKILELLMKEPELTQAKISEKLNIAKRTLKRIFENLKEKKLIERIGNHRKGYWKINK